MNNSDIGEVKQVTPIRAQMQRQGKALLGLEEAVENLDNRLLPVSRERKDTSEDNVEPEQELFSEVALAIQENTKSIDALVNRIGDILRRLEI